MTAKKFCSLLLAGWMLIGSMSGCGTLPGMEETTPQETEETPTVLTNIYAGTELVPPDNIDNQLTEFLYASEDSITFFSATDWRTGNDIEYVLLTYPLSGGEPTVETAPIRNPEAISAFEGGLVYILEKQSASGSTFSLHIRMDDGQEQVLDKIPHTDGFVHNVIRDTDGYIYLMLPYKILVLTPELEEAFTISLTHTVQSCALSDDGVVFVAHSVVNPSTGQGELVYTPVDKSARALGEPFALPEGANPQGYLLGPDYDVYFFNYVGIYGYNTGDSDAVLLMHFENSYLNTIYNFDKLVQAVIGDTFLIYFTDSVTREYSYSLFSPAPDRDLSKIVTLELALLTQNRTIQFFVTEFNKSRQDIQILSKDYTEYNSTENPDGGSIRLGNDILTGTYTPDMIYGSYTDGAVRAVVENDLFWDIGLLLDADTAFHRSDILGCVLNTFQKDGRIFGLPIAFTCDTIIANRELTAHLDSWNADDMLDYIQNLPNGILYMEMLTQSNASTCLFGENGYASFIDFDAGTCSFDSKTFISYLEYLEQLPLTAERLKPLDQFAPYRTGEVTALAHTYTGYVDFLREKMLFGDDNTTYLGFPDKSGTGVTALSQDTEIFLISSSADTPEGCLDFINCTLQMHNLNGIGTIGGFPVLRESLTKAKEEQFKKYYMFNGADLTLSSSATGPGAVFLIGNVVSYDEQFQFTDADWARMEQFLDNAGTPITANALPADVSAIINEELSAYLGSTKSAEACADMIQSRVSIYLAEHN